MRRFAMLCLATSFNAAALSAQQPRPVDDATAVRRIEAYLAPLVAELSGTLLVARGDRVLIERSFGLANYELRVPFTTNTPTNVASITKPLTIIVLQRLIEAGKLSMNDSVSAWLPEYVHGKRMTVAQLASHRAGVPHRLIPEEAQTEPRTASDMVQIANGVQLLFEPGARSVYSSGGYAILAAVLERAAGKSYDQLLQEHVARPINAQTIRHVDRRDLLPGRALSVMPTGASVLNAPLRDLSFLVGGGSVYTTPRDIWNVMRGLVRGAYGDAARSALVRENGLRWNGVTNGYRAFADWHTPDSLAVLFFANAHTGGIDLLRREIPRILAGNAVAPPQVPQIVASPLSDAARARLSGDYDTGGGAVASLRFVSPTLAVFGDRTLAALNDTTFYSFADYARVTFTGGTGGRVEAIQWGAGTWGTGEAGPRFARVLNSR